MSTIDGPLRTYINFKKADWARYAEACEKYLAVAGETRTVEQAEKIFRNAVNKASCIFIPAGRIQHLQRTLPASAKSHADERDRKRRLNPTGETLNDLNKKIKILVVEDKRTKWQSAVDKCDHQTGISHLWRLAKGLSGKQPHNSPNKGVRFADQTYLESKTIANKFDHLFTLPLIRLTGDSTKDSSNAIPSAAINRNAVFHACRHKRCDPIGQILHSHRSRLDEHPLSQMTPSRYHQLSHKHLQSVNLNC